MHLKSYMIQITHLLFEWCTATATRANARVHLRDGTSHLAFRVFPLGWDRLVGPDKLLASFLIQTDEWRDGRLKIVPRVAEGNWVVKRSIGRGPAILGKKVKQFYYRNPEKNYIEIDADLGTSAVAGTPTDNRFFDRETHARGAPAIRKATFHPKYPPISPPMA
jgi:hypothetical protein